MDAKALQMMQLQMAQFQSNFTSWFPLILIRYDGRGCGPTLNATDGPANVFLNDDAPNEHGLPNATDDAAEFGKVLKSSLQIKSAQNLTASSLDIKEIHLYWANQCWSQIFHCNLFILESGLDLAKNHPGRAFVLLS